MRIPRIPLFRIWYSTTYTTLLFILLLLLAISPAETIYQSIRTREIQKLFVIGGAYFLTGIIVLLIYSTRVYTNRTVLQAIPKPYVPIEKGEVGKLVRRMVVKHLRRSAIIAWDSRPRDIRGEGEDEALNAINRPDTAESRRDKEKLQKKSHHHGPPATIIPVSAKSPPWGHVSHPGWATPSSPDLPNLQYWGVILELPNLIEAKAVSLAPPDPAVEDGLQYPGNAPPLPDAQIVTLLQRPRALGLRDYLLRLSDFGLLNPPSLGADFLAQYEYARFSTHSLTEHQFRALMATFAALLNGMTAIDPSMLAQARAHSPYSETRSLAPTESSATSSHSSSSRSADLPYRTPLLNRTRSVSSYSSSASQTDSASARSLSSSDAAHSPHTLRTAPSRQHHRSSVAATPRTPSTRSLRSDMASDTGSVRIRRLGSQQRSPETILPNSSSSSLGSGRSVVRLRRDPGVGELPYEFAVEGG